MSKVDELGLRNTLTRLLEITEGCDPALRLPQNLEAIFYGCTRDGPSRLASIYGDSCDNGEMGITIIRKKTGEATAYRFNLANLIALARLAAGLDHIPKTGKMVADAATSESTRVTELLEANNAYLERARAAERRERVLKTSREFECAGFVTYIEKMREALVPFANEADTWADTVPDNHRSLCTEPGSGTAHPGSETSFTVGDLRRARDLVNRFDMSRHERTPIDPRLSADAH